MTTLEILLISILWIIYGGINSYQHNWFRDFENRVDVFLILGTIIFAPFVLVIRIIRGVFFWNGKLD